MKSLLGLLLLLGCACAPNPQWISLEQRWYPLKRMVHDDSVATNFYVAKGDLVLSGSPLRVFESMGSVQRDGLLIHEQLHAEHEATVGLQWYLSEYASDANFRMSEEKQCYAKQIAYIIDHGGKVDPFYLGQVLSTSYALNWSLADAQAWVSAEISAVGS